MNPINTYILITFIHMLFLKKKRNNILLIVNLLISLANEICLLLIKGNSLSTNIYVFLLFIIWLSTLLSGDSIFKKYKPHAIGVFIFFCGINLLIYHNWWKPNFYNFIIGSLLYCTFFLFQSYAQLKRENFNFFTTNHYLLISSPVLFFMGMSFLFAFDSSDLFYTKIFKEITVYAFISHFVNFIYYSLINWYIYKENKSHV
ncbi:hypothetical protein HNP38_000006 [Chryseobacterium defluvii]|uniref:YhhN-like protein n=1 Tax=Chryseobacterium defluvii TaxID=160396 RepID=A0A840KA85_9FLAO|nr:hypothetical protein [Chryseobacterium defluvii]